MNYPVERQLVCDTGRRLIETGLVAGTWGNVSLLVDEGHMLITPSGQEYMDLQPQDICYVDINTLEYEGRLKPSMERGLHAEIYKQRKGVKAVIHTHSVNACVIASTRQTVPPVIDDMVQIVGPSLKTAEYGISGSKKLTKNVLKALKGRNAALLANHGGVCIGRDMEEAFTTCQLVEKCCRIFIESECIGGAVNLNKVESIIMHEYYMKIYSQKKRKMKQSQ